MLIVVGLVLAQDLPQMVLAGLARRRIVIDRHRHRDRKTKARPGFPHAKSRLPARIAPAQISICRPLAT